MVEVLIVVAVILTIAAITFPVFSRAKESAKATTCVGNLSQIGVALALYATDHDNRFPPYNTWDSGKFTIDVPIEEWVHRDSSALFKKALMRYGLSDEQFYCPSDPYARSDDVQLPFRTLKFSTTYEHSGMVGRFQAASYSFEDFHTDDPAAFMYLLESPVGFVDSSRPGPEGMQDAVYPHGAYTITLFLDGHVKRVPFKPSP